MKKIVIPILIVLCVLLAAATGVLLYLRSADHAAFSAAETALNSGLERAEAAKTQAEAKRSEMEDKLTAAQADAEAMRQALSAAQAKNEELTGELTAAQEDSGKALEDAAARYAALEAELAAAHLEEDILANRTLTEHSMATAHFATLKYLVYDPGVEHDEPLPLMLFLHGSGGCGYDIDAIYKDDMIPNMLRDGRITPNAIVVMPQCPGNTWITMYEDVMEILTAVAEEYGTDPERVSVTGFSLGGIGTFSMLIHYPDYFAAALPLSAGTEPSECDVITSTPVRIFHGGADETMPLSTMERANDVINDAGGTCSLTVFPGEGHFIQQHYLDEGCEPLEWLISQRRTPAGDTSEDETSADDTSADETSADDSEG